VYPDRGRVNKEKLRPNPWPADGRPAGRMEAGRNDLVRHRGVVPSNGASCGCSPSP